MRSNFAGLRVKIVVSAPCGCLPWRGSREAAPMLSRDADGDQGAPPDITLIRRPCESARNSKCVRLRESEKSELSQETTDIFMLSYYVWIVDDRLAQTETTPSSGTNFCVNRSRRRAAKPTWQLGDLACRLHQLARFHLGNY